MFAMESEHGIWQCLKHGPLTAFVVGSGNWGTTVAKLVATNAASSFIFNKTVKMWCYEEIFEGRKLTDIINTDHENKKYLAGIKLPENIIAVPDLIPHISNADLLIFVLPHQFLPATLDVLAGHVKSSAKAVSLTKGFDVRMGYPKLLTRMISEKLRIPCCMLAGANIARDVALEQFSECALGYRENHEDEAIVWQQLFDLPYFKVSAVPDICGVEVCAALKNVIAVGIGFAGGMGYGNNTKAALMRIGVNEMKLFANIFCDGILEDTFYESCGYADTIATSIGGRNVRCATEFVKRGCKDSWEKIEADLLKGQKMQGHLTAKEVYQCIDAHKLQSYFPLFTAVYEIAFTGADPKILLERFQNAVQRPVRKLKACNTCILPEELIDVKSVIRGLKSRTTSQISCLSTSANGST